jgi:hypothetical protein
MVKAKTEKTTVITSLKNVEKGLTAWDNDLIEGISKFNLKPTQLKLVLLLSSKIKKDTQIPVFTFRTSELVKVMGFSGNNGYHLKKLLEEMRGKTIRLQRRNGGFSVFGWIVAADVYPIKPPPLGYKEIGGVFKDIFINGCSGETKEVKEYREEMERQFLSGTTTIKLDERITPFLMALADNFTEIEMKYILGFRSVHAMQLYILAKRFGDTGWREDDEFALRQKLSSGEYKDWGNFKKRVLKPAIEEVNKTDIRLKYTKTGSTVRWEINPVVALPSRRETSAADAAKLKELREDARRRMNEYVTERWSNLSPEDRAERIVFEGLQEKLFSFNLIESTDEELAVCRFTIEDLKDDKYYQRLLAEAGGV